MKKYCALLLAVCLLFNGICAQAMSMEQMLFSALPHVLARLPGGFDAQLETDYGTGTAALTADERGEPLLLWGDGSQLYVLRQDAVLQALMMALTGANEWPEARAEDAQLLADFWQALVQAASKAVVQNTQTTSYRTDTEVTIALRTLLVEIDSAMQEILTARASDVDALLSRYTPVLEALELQPVPSAADLLALWKEANLSGLLPLEIPLKIKLSAGGGLSDPWTASASLLGMYAQARWDGTHFDCRLSTGAEQYVFDTRDLQKLGELIISAAQTLSSQAVCMETEDESFLLRVRPVLLGGELQSRLLALLRQNRSEVQALLVRYAPWFGLQQMPAEQLEQKLYALVGDLCYALTTLPDLEIRAQQNGELFSLAYDIAGVNGHLRIAEQAADMHLPLFGYTLDASAMYSDDAFSLCIADLSVTGTRDGSLWNVNLYADEEPALQGVVTDSYAKFEIVDEEVELLALWDDHSLHISTSDDSFDLTLLFDDEGASCSVLLPSFRISGECCLEDGLTLDVEWEQSIGRNTQEYAVGLLASEDTLRLEYSSGFHSRGLSSSLCAEIKWLGSGVQLHADAASGFRQFSLDYRPGWFALTTDRQSLTLSDLSLPGDPDSRIQIMAADRSGVQSAELHSRFSNAGCELALLGEEENATLKISTRPAPLTDAKLQAYGVQLITPQQILQALGLDQPQEEPAETTASPEPSAEPAAPVTLHSGQAAE